MWTDRIGSELSQEFGTLATIHTLVVPGASGQTQLGLYRFAPSDLSEDRVKESLCAFGPIAGRACPEERIFVVHLNWRKSEV
jgi:hypothetical protein